MLPLPQKLPDVTEPCTCVSLTTVKFTAVSPVWLWPSLNSRLAWVVAGKVKSAMPVRDVAVSAVVMPSSSFTW